MSFKILSIMDAFFSLEMKPKFSYVVGIGDFSCSLDEQSTSAVLKDLPGLFTVLAASQTLLE